MVRALAIAAALSAVPTLAAAQTAVQPVALLPGETLLEVAAHGTVSAVPDVATFRATVVGDGASADAARGRAAALATRVLTAARAAGVADDALRTEVVRVAPRYRKDKDGDDTDTVVGYRAETRVVIRLRRLATGAALYDALVGAGAERVDGPDFAFADETPLRTRARAAAVAAAQAQEADYARPFGLKVARVLRISERGASTSVMQDIVVTAMKRGIASPALEPGTQDVSVDVWIDYALVPER